MQPVGGHQVPGRLPVDQDVVAGVDDAAHRALLDRDAGQHHRPLQPAQQRRPSYAAAGTAPEGRVDRVRPVDVADALQRPAFQGHAEVQQVRDRRGHQPLAAGLVDHALAGLEHDDVEAGPRGVQRRHQPDRAAAGHHQVAHQAPTPASAVFSTRSRTVSSAALSSVNTSAVTQAACTMGSATPSTTTAT